MSEEDNMTETQIRPRPRPGSAANPPAELTPRSARPSGLRPAFLYAIGAAGLVIALLVALLVVLLVKRSDDSDAIAKYKSLESARSSVLTAARKYAIDF